MKKSWLFKIGLLLILLAILIAGGFFVLKSKSSIFNRADGLNLLILTLDTTRADRIGAYGCSAAQTPNIDRLARQGIRFENCYTPVPLTSPAHCSLFTGKYPIGHGVRNNGSYFLAADEVTLAEVMKQKGFATHAAVASFVLHSKFGLDQGFDDYDDSLDIEEMMNVLSSEITAEQVYGKYKKWVSRRDQTRPFFTWLHFFDPHIPYQPPPQFREKFSDEFWGPYDGEIAYMDHYIGKIIEDLKSRGILENTLIILAADHGEALGEHQEHGHGIFCYEESIKVPLIFYNPRLFPESKVIKTPVNLVDLMPTVLDLYGKEEFPGLQGQSLSNVLGSKDAGAERLFYFESMYGKEEYGWAPLTGIIAGEYKYIALPKSELYNLQTDSEEEKNLFLEKNRLARELDRRLIKLISSASVSGSDSRRAMSEEDRQHLKSLGYISSFSGKGDQPFDPKIGIELKNKYILIQHDIETGQLEKAEAELRKIVESHPEMKIPKYYTLINDIQRRRKDITGLENSLLEAVARFPQNQQFKFNLANFYFSVQNKVAEAERICHDILKEDPTYTLALLLLSRIAEMRADLPRALQYLEDSLKIESHNISLQLKYCQLLKENRNVKKLEAVCSKLAADESVIENENARLKLGIFLTELRKDDLAYSLLSGLTGKEHQNAEAWNYLGILYFRKKEYRKALEAYQHSLRLDSQNATAYNNLGTLYLTWFVEERDMKLYDQSLEAFNRALEINPHLASALNGRASALKFANRVGEALRDWKRVIKISPGFIDAYFNIGITFLQANLRTEALNYFTLCKERNYSRLSPRDRNKLDRLIAEAEK
jgi:arylsulfatase A-like enzyme/predicted Zn-dependent protease